MVIRVAFKFKVWHKVGNFSLIMSMTFCTKEQNILLGYFKDINVWEYSRAVIKL